MTERSNGSPPSTDGMHVEIDASGDTWERVELRPGEDSTLEFVEKRGGEIGAVALSPVYGGTARELRTGIVRRVRPDDQLIFVDTTEGRPRVATRPIPDITT